MIEMCKHCGAALASVTADRCPSCGARIDALRPPMQPTITPTAAPRVLPPPNPEAQTRYTPEIALAPVSPASAAPVTSPVTPPARRSRRRLWLILGLVGALVLAICGSGGGILYWAITSQL